MKKRKKLSRKHYRHKKRMRIRVKYRGRNFYLCNFVGVKENGKNVFLFRPNRNGSMDYYAYNGVNRRWMNVFLKEMKRSGFKNVNIKETFKKILMQEKALSDSMKKSKRKLTL